MPKALELRKVIGLLKNYGMELNLTQKVAADIPGNL